MVRTGYDAVEGRFRYEKKEESTSVANGGGITSATQACPLAPLRPLVSKKALKMACGSGLR